jgi:hypothetical protein
VTGAPIYLVSACTSGEEFVAAFRRYADKNGLFVPMGEPLPSGCRGRFAVTLKDGGVMIEGEAEVTSSARTASVVHGRVGMTLRFLEPDAASKTLLGELEKARLAMRPAPPSVSPRPAEVPAEPRPVPPPVQGRIDAINALAECVAIGDTGVLAPPAVSPPIATPPKAGPRFVVPAVPPASGLGAARSSATPRPASSVQAAPSSPPSATAKPPERDGRDGRDGRDERKAALPVSSTPHARLLPDQLRTGLERRSDHPGHADPVQALPSISGFSTTMTAVTPVLANGPASDTFAAVKPPEPPGPGAAFPAAPRRAVEMAAAIPRPITRPQPVVSARDRLPSDTINAVPDGMLSLPSAPTEVGGGLVAPLPRESGAATPSREDLSSPTQIHAGAPAREAKAATSDANAPRSPARAESSLTRRPPMPELTQAPRSYPPETPQDADEEVPEVHGVGSTGAKGAPSHVATHIGMPPVPRGPAPVSPPPVILTPAPPIVAARRPPVPEVEIAEPTDISQGPPEPVEEPPDPPDAEPEPSEHPSSRQRKTVIGVAIAPPGMTVMPAASVPDEARDTAAIDVVGDLDDTANVAEASLRAAEEVTSADRIVVGDNTVDASAPTLPPGPRSPSMLDEATPNPASIMPPAGATPASSPGKPPPTPVRPATPATPATPASTAPTTSPAKPASPPATLPTGDWTIALDPQAPDGWSEPISPEHATKEPRSIPPATGAASPPSAVAAKSPPAGATPAGATPTGATPTVAAKSPPAGGTPAGATPAGATPAGATPAGATPAGATPAGATPAVAAKSPPAGAAKSPPAGAAEPPSAITAKPLAAVAPPLTVPATPPAAVAEPPPAAAAMPPAAVAAPPAAVAAPPLAAAAMPPLPATASAPPRDGVAKRQTPRPDELPMTEPKVQIDPTLIEPLRPAPSDPPLRPMPPDVPLHLMPPDDPFRDAATSSPEMPGYGMPPGSLAAPAPHMNMGTAMPSNPFLAGYSPPVMHPGEAPSYPMDPNYQVVPGAGLNAPGPFPMGGGLGDPRYASATALPAQSGRRHLIIVLVSALVAVAIGAVALYLVSRKHDAGPTPGTEVDKPRPSPVAAPKPAKAAAIAPDSPPPAPRAGSSAPVPPADPPPAPPKAPPESAAAATGSAAVAVDSDAAEPAAGTCFAEVSSVPAAAEIVIEPNVIGTTPQKITLPCGAPVELAIRKGRFLTATRTVTPTPEGVKLKVALAKPTFQLKVSSTPPGATITMNGKPLGVTPTTVRLPAFEASTLTITKDGYATETETVTPKANGVAVHSALKKLDRKRPH